jgi:AcrR family transcriptional regulator
MARIVKETEYARKRNEILDVALQLTLSQGYEQMSIQDILDGLKISKGAFFHYFGSKSALLQAMVDRMLDEGMRQILPIARDPNVTALEKLQRFFATLVRWKTDQKVFFMAMLPVWYGDDNAIVRQKVRSERSKTMGALLAEIILQGTEQGSFTAPYSDQIGEVALCLIESLVDALSGLLITPEPNQDRFDCMESTVMAYTGALERTLGAAPGSLEIIDMNVLKEWLA